MFQTTSAETFTAYFHTKLHIFSRSVSLVFAMKQKYENRFSTSAILFYFYLNLTLVNAEYF
jgi:hypothetical protein